MGIPFIGKGHMVIEYPGVYLAVLSVGHCWVNESSERVGCTSTPWKGRGMLLGQKMSVFSDRALEYYEGIFQDPLRQ